MNQLKLFDRTQEKGSREWNLATGVKHEKAGMFRVASPQQPRTPRYGNIIHIRRYRQPQRLFPSRA